jgi:hypothetical protein
MDDIVEVTLQVHGQTQLAYFCSESGNKKDAQWVAKSKIEATKKLSPGIYEFSLPEWIALENGWI